MVATKDALILLTVVAAAGLSSVGAARLRATQAGAANGSWSAKPRFAVDCGVRPKRHSRKMHRMSLASVEQPGAGMDPESISPYETVYKDDFKYIDCAKDALFESGDKWGDGKFVYKVENLYNVSIIHYADTIPSEDQVLMSQKVCFEFCRTVPLMGFFGITAGRDCYCAPFYDPVPGDSSSCDLPCTGEAVPSTGMCGGKTKSAIFEMHMCAATGQDLGAAISRAEVFEGNASVMSKDLLGVATALQLAAAEAQEVFGEAGDPVAAGLMQGSKDWAGTLEHAAEDLGSNVEGLGELIKSADAMSGSDFSKSDAVLAAETAIAEMDQTVVEGEELYETAAELFATSTKGKGESRGSEYYPLMYFVDKKYENKSSTCGGTWDGKPVMGVNFTECAAACDIAKAKPACVGFFYHSEMCLLFSKFKTLMYYTECEDQKADASATGCFAKLEDFVNTNLTPDPKGKNELALRELAKADRCFK